MTPVLTKKDFVRRFKQGEFGNRGPVWETLEQFKASGYMGPTHLRSRIPGGAGFYDTPADEVEALWFKHGPKNFYLAAMAPSDKTLFQGEVQRGYRGLELTYSLLPLPMRDALARQTLVARGIMVNCLLRHYLDTRSYEWLQYLLDTYPDHVVEFSTYSCCWGTIPGMNTVFWEVRAY